MGERERETESCRFHHLPATADGEEDIAGEVHENGLLLPVVGVVIHPEHDPAVGVVEDGVPIAVEQQRLPPHRQPHRRRRAQTGRGSPRRTATSAAAPLLRFPPPL
ncbi:hypothetical protein AXF42_Ash016449 [Apostasia shenzhenica]|uniref:Uncharacterized protein n=1 Tax=Apostasia shenzhenica TaxID=1088818 RepID=A0A2I0A058_9ASPA|nr:hypothetical protein AXF42_Ash016449 [Apostasia shenzhenica]